MKSYCPCEISYHCGLCSTNTQKIEKTSDEQSKPTPLTLTFIQEICHLQRLTNRKQQYVSIDASNLNYLTSCLNGRKGSFESMQDCAAVTMHYACVDCWGFFLVSDEPCADGCRLAFWWGTRLCLGPAGRPLTWSGTAYLDITLVASQTAGASYCIVYYIIILFII